MTAGLTAATALAIGWGTPAHALGPDAVRSGFDTTVYGGNDDGTWPCVGEETIPFGCTPAPLALPFPINFFGTTYNDTFLNNNGNLTFDSALPTYTPFPILNSARVIIAPFFADVDTRVGTTVKFGSSTVGGRPAFGVTWPGVGCFLRNDDVQDHFQVVLIDRSDLLPGDFDIEFNYDKIEWETGMASGGDPSCLGGDSARVGFSDGVAESFELPGSGIPGAFLDGHPTTGLVDHSLNTSQLGRYVFRVRNGVPNTPPSIDAPDSVPAVYSDPITPVTVSATDANPADVVALSATGVPAGLTFTDNGDRTGTLSGTPTVAAGTYAVTVTASDGVNAPVSRDVNVVVAKEDCTLTSPPVILSSAGSSTALTTTFGEADATLGDRGGKAVAFTAVDSSLVSSGPYGATTDAGGVANTTADLGTGSYGVRAAFTGDGFYNACATATDTIVVVAAAEAKATGGGWTSTGGRTSFGFNATRDVTGLHGQLQVRSAQKDRFHGNTVSTLSGTATTAQWTGTGTWNRQDGYRYSVSVVDNGSSGARKLDTISIVIRKPAGDDTVVFSTGGPQPLKGGNVTVH